MTLSSANGYHPKSARIMVVDDEPTQLKSLGLMLRSEGYAQLELVHDPREVIGRYRAMRPDLILLDVDMPPARALMAQLQALAEPLPALIVVLSTPSVDGSQSRTLAHGASDFLSKPVKPCELLARVHNTLMAQLAQRLLYEQDRQLEQRVLERTAELRQSRLQLVRRLALASEFRDHETGQHVLRMSHASALLARTVGWDESDCDLMLNASPLHDVGKIGIPHAILLKPGPLTPDEREIMQTHTTIGAEILSEADGELMSMARDIALGHHEKWDGSGYPRGLAGIDIPQAARIVAITDVFDALTSQRPYKKAWSIAEALSFMGRHAGSQLDPHLYHQFVPLVPQMQQIRERFAEPAPVEVSPAEAADAR